MRPLLASITSSAQQQIQRIRQQYKDQTGEDSIPAIAWLDSKLNPILASSSVCIGLYHESSRHELSDDICDIDGVECLVSVLEENEHLFEGKTLDYDKGWVLK
jgi:hypothetical protein